MHIVKENCATLCINLDSGVNRPPEGQGQNGVTRAQSQTEGVAGPRSPSARSITTHNFIKILSHVVFSILQAV